VWHVKESSLLKAVSAISSPVTGNGDSRQIAEKLLVRFKTKQTIGKKKNTAEHMNARKYHKIIQSRIRRLQNVRCCNEMNENCHQSFETI
jgi:hypothetical protein